MAQDNAHNESSFSWVDTLLTLSQIFPPQYSSFFSFFLGNNEPTEPETNVAVTEPVADVPADVERAVADTSGINTALTTEIPEDAQVMTSEDAPATDADAEGFSWSAAGDLYGFDASALENIEEGVEISDADMSNRDTAFGASFLDAARVLYEERKGEPVPEGWSDDRLANWADNRVSWFQNNIGSVASAAWNMGDKERENAALMYLVEMNEKTEKTWGDRAEGGVRMLLDVSNLGTVIAGAFSFGSGGAAVEAGKQAARVAVKSAVTTAVKNQTVRAVTRSAAYAAAEGVATAGLENTATQHIQMGVKDSEDGNANSLREDFSYGEAAFSAGIGGVAGAGIGGGLAFLGKAVLPKLGQRFAEKGITWENVFGNTRDYLDRFAKDEDGSVPLPPGLRDSEPTAGGATASDTAAPTTAATTNVSPPVAAASTAPTINAGMLTRVGDRLRAWEASLPVEVRFAEHDVTTLNTRIPLDFKWRGFGNKATDEAADAGTDAAQKTATDADAQPTTQTETSAGGETVKSYRGRDVKTNEVSDLKRADEAVEELNDTLISQMNKSISDALETLNKDLKGLKEETDIKARVESFLDQELPNIKRQLDAKAGPEGLAGYPLELFNRSVDGYTAHKDIRIEDAIRQNALDVRLVRRVKEMGQSLAQYIAKVPGVGTFFKAINIFDTDGFASHISNGVRGVKNAVSKVVPYAGLPRAGKSRTVRHFVDHITDSTTGLLTKVGKAGDSGFIAARDQAVADYRAMAAELRKAHLRIDQRGGPKSTKETDIHTRGLAYYTSYTVTGRQKESVEQFVKHMDTLADEIEAQKSPAAFQKFMEEAAANINGHRPIFEHHEYLIASTFEVGNQLRRGDTILPGRTNLAQKERLQRAISQGFHPESIRTYKVIGNRENYGYNKLENMAEESETSTQPYVDNAAQTLWEVYERGLEVDALAHLEFAVNKLGDNPNSAAQSDPIPRFDEILKALEVKVQRNGIPGITKLNERTGEHEIVDKHFKAYIERLRKEEEEVWRPNPQGTRNKFFEYIFLGRNLDGRKHSRRENRKRLAYSSLPRMIATQYRESFSEAGATKPTDAQNTYFMDNVVPRNWEYVHRYLRGHEIDYNESYNGESGLYANPRAFRWQYKDVAEGGSKWATMPWKQGSIYRHTFNTAWRVSGLGLPELALFYFPKTAFNGMGVYATTRNMRYGARIAGIVGAGAAIENYADEDSLLQYHPAALFNDPYKTAVEVSVASTINAANAIPGVNWIVPNGNTPVIGNLLPDPEAGLFYDSWNHIPYGGALTLGSQFTGIGNTSDTGAENDTADNDTSTETQNVEETMAMLEEGEYVEAALKAAPFNVEVDATGLTIWSLTHEALIENVRTRAANKMADENFAGFTDALKNAVPAYKDLTKEQEAATIAAYEHFLVQANNAAPSGQKIDANSPEFGRLAVFAMMDQVNPAAPDQFTNLIKIDEAAEVRFKDYTDTLVASLSSLPSDKFPDGVTAESASEAIEGFARLMSGMRADGDFIVIDKDKMTEEFHTRLLALLDLDNNGIVDTKDIEAAAEEAKEEGRSLTEKLTDAFGVTDATVPQNWAETKSSIWSAFNTLTDHDSDGYGVFVDTAVGRSISGTVKTVWDGAANMVGNLQKTRGGNQTLNGMMAFGGALFAPWALSKIPGFGWLNARGVRTLVIFASFFLGWKALNGGGLDIFKSSGDDSAGQGDGDFVAGKGFKVKTQTHEGGVPQIIEIQGDFDGDEDTLETINVFNTDNDDIFAAQLVNADGSETWASNDVLSRSAVASALNFTPDQFRSDGTPKEDTQISIEAVPNNGGEATAFTLTIGNQVITLDHKLEADIDDNKIAELEAVDLT